MYEYVTNYMIGYKYMRLRGARANDARLNTGTGCNRTATERNMYAAATRITCRSLA